MEARGGKTYLDETFLPPVNIKWVFSEAWDYEINPSVKSQSHSSLGTWPSGNIQSLNHHLMIKANKSSNKTNKLTKTSKENLYLKM